DDAAALLELAQIAQALLKCAQLRVIEPAGCFLAIAGDEGHGRAFIEQRRCCCYLSFANPKLLRDPPVNRSRHASTFSLHLHMRHRQYVTKQNNASAPRACIW